MRKWWKTVSVFMLVSIACPLSAGCDDDEEEVGDGAALVPEDAADGAPTPMGDAAVPTADAPPSVQAPNIVSVSWMPVGACTAGRRSHYTVTIHATGDNLTYSGTVQGCQDVGQTTGTATLTGATTTISCPNLAGYPGTAQVTNSAGTDSQSFTITVCQAGSAP